MTQTVIDKANNLKNYSIYKEKREIVVHIIILSLKFVYLLSLAYPPQLEISVFNSSHYSLLNKIMLIRKRVRFCNVFLFKKGPSPVDTFDISKTFTVFYCGQMENVGQNDIIIEEKLGWCNHHYVTNDIASMFH